MGRTLFLSYSFVCYVLSIGSLVYLFLFIGNLGIERSIDGPARIPWLPALCVDVALLLMFAVPHSLLARRRTKAILSRILTVAAERSTYVLVTSLALLLLFVAWQPIELEIWRVESHLARGILYGMFVFGWLTVLVAISLTNHFDLFGLRQAWCRFLGQPYRRIEFTTRWLYRYVRHPLYLGWLFAFWSAPAMTAGHLLFATVLSIYIFLAIPWEEADLIAQFGKRYVRYRERVPKLIPSLPLGETDAYVLDRNGQYVGPEEIQPRTRDE